MRLNAMVVALCVVSLGLHLALVRRAKPEKQEDAVSVAWRSPGVPGEGGEGGVRRASKWSRRLSWSPRPPRNATRKWLPELGGVCGPPSDVEPLPFETLPDARRRARVEEGPRKKKKKNRPKGMRRRLLSTFTLPVGCAPLVRRRTRRDADDDDAPIVGECDLATCLPNLFVVGVSKAGTTTLFEALVAHPRVVAMFSEPFTHGETHVFTDPRSDRESAMRALKRTTPMSRDFLRRAAPGTPWRLDEANDGPLYVLEYTPHYIVLPAVRRRVCGALAIGGVDCGDAKFAFMLRDPARRALSQWIMKTHMRVPRYNDPRSFDEAVAFGMERATNYARCWDVAANETSNLDDLRLEKNRRTVATLAQRCAPKRFEPNLFQAYVLKSAYYYQLLPWLAPLDAPTKSAAVVVLEHFVDDPTEFIRLLAFLGLTPSVFDDIHALVSARHNPARDGGLNTLTPAQKLTLDDFFRPYNRKLDTLVAPLLGRAATGYPT
ncbi:hypothetical protein CTAYLR_000629 [Chrysophaeum taylorii]|uniref:Sulfotransferase n=1 Tax=Chrysophaeum taylorii TaxID=2483200 RepID=A0AAD7U8S0_9STRA|nr:hypothetical protein CTAYLR_000629 [Chrysophaeum taylorii]